MLGINQIEPNVSDISLCEDLDVDVGLRKRRIWNSDVDSLTSATDIDLLDDDEILEEEEAGCPLPSTPEDNQLLEAEVRD